MILTQKTREVLTSREGLHIRNRLAYEMGKHSVTIDRWIEANEQDNDLTKAIALQIIKEETGMTEAEILTHETAQA